MGLFAPAYGGGQVGESADESWFSVYGFGQISSLTEPQFPAPLLAHGLTFRMGRKWKREGLLV